MALTKYNDSPYKYTDPIRLFKANDPYYWEVDNIPLKQLEENVKWLKDQLKQEETDSSNLSVNRVNINELRPYALGSDRVVRVKPGRFTARVNDASSKTRLQTLTQVLGTALAETDAWDASTLISNSALLTAVTKFTESPISGDQFIGANGLDERAFTWAVRNEDEAGAFAGSMFSPLQYSGFSGAGKAGPFPYSQAITWAKSKDDATSTYIIKGSDPLSVSVGFGKLPLAENHFIKYWRGVARTSIVDVPEELEIQIPEWNSSDFSYTDANGDQQEVAGVQSRIDLVFIYSKAVDQASTKIFDGGKVSTISTPTLGIVRGAGIGASLAEGSIETDYSPVISYDANGNPQLLANPGDTKSPGGFISASGNDISVDVKGSFPSPDDLMNIAPLLSEALEDSAIELVGQSILPVAYVFVNSTDIDVDVEDVIDIRPLFRTAELTYSERTGIAAAMPQLSLANPAVGKAQLDSELRKFNANVIDLVGGGGAESQIQTVATGYVFGGWHWGPEAVLLSAELGHDFQPEGGVISTEADLSNSKVQVRKNYGFPMLGGSPLITIPSFPDWDHANWVGSLFKSDPGNFPHDYIDHYNTRDRKLDKFVYSSLGGKVNNDGTMPVPSHIKRDEFHGGQGNKSGSGDGLSFYFVKKKILFDRPTWLADYTIDVKFNNCVPISDAGSNGGYDNATVSDWWVEKGDDNFTIYVGFPAEYSEHGSHEYASYANKIVDRTNIERFSTFMVPVEMVIEADMADDNTTDMTGFVGNPSMGVCTLPTVMWTMTGIPNTQVQYLHGNLKESNSLNIKGLL
jgi:hypothetical protein